ncbi:hypothetical protein FHX37_0590 [Haloactinospora alba]|uniref:Lipoprotein n=2 Tax=Haloactinospora alba TaxID=405555 RepID=A0A543NFT5_9ACTN|nr:hypothetical protein FHX37_0590 [Haloactinospora alba]
MASVHSHRRRPGKPLRFAVVAVAFAAGTAGCSIDLSDFRPGGGEEEEASPSPTPVDAGPVLDSALEQLGSGAATVSQGQVAASEDSPVNQVSLTVTDAGAVSGTLQQGENEAEVMEADGKLFVNAPEEYWLDQEIVNPDTDKYAGNWVRVTGDQLGFDPASVLTPEQLSAALGELAPDGGEAVPEKLDGDNVYRIDLKGGDENRVWVSEEEPHRLLRLEVEELAPEGGDSGPRTRLDFSEPEEEKVREAYDTLTSAAEDSLDSSRDARIEVNWDGELDLDCEVGGKCTVNGTVTDASGDSGADGSVAVRMDATVNNDELGEKTCKDTASLDAGGNADVSCTIDYDLSPSANPQEYSVSGDALLSTRGITGDAQDKLVNTIEDSRDATLEKSDSSGDSDKG